MPVYQSVGLAAHKAMHASGTTLTVLLTYDCMLTSKDELNLIWHRQKSVASVIFVANRVPAALFVIITSMLNANTVSRRLMHCISLTVRLRRAFSHVFALE